MKQKKQGNGIFLFFRGPRKEAKDYFSNFVPAGLFNILYYLLKNGYEPKLYNLSNFTEKDVSEIIKSLDIRLALISTFTGNHISSIKLAKTIKTFHKKSVTVLGGPFSLLAEEILARCPDIDFVVKGEGETASLKLARFIEGKEELRSVEGLCYRSNTGIVKNIATLNPNIDDFFYLPSKILPYCNFVQNENFAVLITSRGCSYRCSFCSSPVLWQNKIRFHSINNLIEYIKDLKENLGQIYFSIRDDNFLMNQKRVLEFTKKFSETKLGMLWNTQGSVKFINDEVAYALAQSDCDQVQMGIESASERILHFFNKELDKVAVQKAISSLRKYLIRPFGYFIGGVNETEKEAEETCNFIKNSGIIDGIISPLVIYPGTKLYKKSMADDFFSDKEIIYYSLHSYKKFKKNYLNALKQALNKNSFTLNDVRSTPTTSFLKDITKFYCYLSAGDTKMAKKVLSEIGPKNIWYTKLENDLKG